MTLARHLLRAKDLADLHYAEPIGVADMAAAAGLSQAHFTRTFTAQYGVTPHAYLLTRRLERAAALLRNTDQSVADICVAVGLSSVGSFTTSFKRMYGCTPTDHRAAYAAVPGQFVVPGCVVRAYARPEHRTFREDRQADPSLLSDATEPAADERGARP